VITLTITFDPQTAQVSVSGPIDGKTLCYGMLEAAKDAIREHCAKQASGIIQASPQMAAVINATNA
jgi:hypothetical protein